MCAFALILDARSKKLICADVIRLYQNKVDEIKQRIVELTELRDCATARSSVCMYYLNSAINASRYDRSVNAFKKGLIW